MPDDLADVYRSTYHALVRFLYRKVWDAERAEDLAQEAFARALVHKQLNGGRLVPCLTRQRQQLHLRSGRPKQLLLHQVGGHRLPGQRDGGDIVGEGFVRPAQEDLQVEGDGIGGG